MDQRQKIIAVVGPTASGKSDLGVHLARAFGGEVISADSRQVYRGLDIATGKITKREMRGVPHHLLDVASPRRAFSAARFKVLAERAIRDIERRGKLPIIVGGTGFYVDVLLGVTPIPNVPPDQRLRSQLAQKTTPELVAILKKLDRQRAAKIDVHNRHRLIRAIEIATALGNIPSHNCIDTSIHYDVLWIGVTHPPQTLRKRIVDRAHARMRRGMAAEARRLHAKGLSYKRMRELGLEYRALADYLQGCISKEEFLKELEVKIWQYAKRQLTWFKRNKAIHWFQPSQQKQIESLIERWIRQMEGQASKSKMLV